LPESNTLAYYTKLRNKPIKLKRALTLSISTLRITTFSITINTKLSITALDTK
jgi:hypothetical protein